MKQNDLTVYFVSYKTPVLPEILIKSFEKFNRGLFNIKYLAVENSDYDLNKYLSQRLDTGVDLTVFNNNSSQLFSHGHGEGLEFAKKEINSEYVFTCHTDVCITSEKFIKKLKFLIENNFDLAGVCEDAHPDRVQALHCSGLLCKNSIFQKVSLLPQLPKIDTADLLTVYCRDNQLKTFLFENTYNKKELYKVCNEPFKSLGPDCGIDRCLHDDEVVFIHQGRGTSKNHGNYFKPGKVNTAQWVQLCNYILSEGI